MIGSNSTPLIALARAGHLDLLRQVHRHLAIPFEVWDEVVIKGAGRPGAVGVEAAAWVEVLHVADRVAVSALQAAHPSLGAGEVAAIVLARERRTSLLLSDDPLARKVAEGEGLAVGGTLSSVLHATRAGLISQAAEVLDDLRASGFRLSDRLYREVLSAAGE